MSALEVERIESEEALLRLGPEWQELEARSGNGLPFRTFGWVASWWRHLREDRAAVRDSLALRAVRDERGRLVCVVPLVLTERPAVGPIRFRCLQLIGADPNITEVRGALCDPAREAECHAVVYDDIQASRRTPDCVRWSGLGERGAMALGSSATGWTEGRVCYVLHLPASWPELQASRPRNLKESLRKCYNSLRREGLTCRLDVVRSSAELPRALDDFFRLHGARADLDGTVKHRNVFEHPRCRAFLEDVCERFAAQGTLRLFRLFIGDRAVATRIGFAMGETLYLYYSGYDPAFARYGVMTTTVAEALKYAIGEGFRHVNLSTGSDVSKLRWRPEPMTFRDATFASSSPVGWVKFRAASAVERALRDVGAARFFARRQASVADGGATA